MAKPRERGQGRPGLREAAETELARQPAGPGPEPGSAAALLHELQVHQVELELQNEELRRARLEVEQARDVYLDLYDFAPVGYFTVAADDRLAGLNLAAAAALGADRAALLGRPFASLVAPASRTAWAAHLEQVRRSGATGRCEVELRPAAGAPLVAQVTSARGAGDQADVRCSLVDVTERRRAEEERARRVAALEDLNHRLEATQQQLLQAAKMAAIGQLAAGVAHEINGPISYLRSNLHLAAEGISQLLDLARSVELAAGACTPDCPARRRLAEVRATHHQAALQAELQDELKESRQGLDRVSRLVGDLLAYAHPDTGPPTRADLHQIVDRVVRVVGGATASRGRISCTDLAGPLTLRCRPAQIEQVLVNLLTNAVQAAASGPLELRTGRLGEEVWVEVEDHGPGIAPEHLDRLFEPFFTTKPVGEGTGLGLSIAHGIVRSHGGRIEVRSAPGAGASFKVVLPVNGPAAALPVAPAGGRYGH